MLIYPLVQLIINSSHFKNRNSCGEVVITTAQFHSAKPELRFCPGSIPNRGASNASAMASI